MDMIEYNTPSAVQINRPKNQQKLLDRIYKISESTTKQLAKDKSITFALSLTDGELMQLLFEKLLERDTQVSDRELLRINRENEGMRKLFERLKALGGTLKAGKVAERLGITRQSVNNWLKTDRLLAIKPANDYLFPEFQFIGTQVVNSFDDVLQLLPKDMSSVTKMSFFTAMYFFDDVKLNVIDAMKLPNADEYLDKIKQQAAIFGQHTAS